jgi:hypothetical protein
MVASDSVAWLVGLDHGPSVATAGKLPACAAKHADHRSAVQCLDNLVERRLTDSWFRRLLGLTDLLSHRTDIRVFGTSTRYDRCCPGDLDHWFPNSGVQRLSVAIAVSKRRVYVSNSASHWQSSNAGGDWRRHDDLAAGERQTTGSVATDSCLVDVVDMGCNTQIRSNSNVAHGIGMWRRLFA